MTCFNDYCKDNDLRVNERKTKCMLINMHGDIKCNSISLE